MEETKKARQQLAADFHSLIEHSQDLLKATAGDLDEKTKEARKKIEKTIEKAKEKYRVLEDKVAEGLETTDRLIHEKPYHAIGVTFVVGFVIGLLIGRRK